MKYLSRRKILAGGAIVGASASIGLDSLSAIAASPQDKQNDIQILNQALYHEHRAIWTYGSVVGSFTQTEVGRAVKAIALRHLDDHKKHADTLVKAIASLEGTPIEPESKYDFTTYINAREGYLNSDVNIAKLALALEVDAAIAYTREISKLKTPELIVAGGSIAATESAHAASIRSLFKYLGVKIEIVPSAFVSAENRSAWVMKV